ncbi:B-cell differentiation antigen CD72-like isoform X2 [Lagopus muta]|uniref:B-cell differentiation antigen CD72-like isoform X2 n=1 Tax=Lagopus muta TaxID=64668 RepID=UPI0020A1C958|nr:B-cell differentiation antigen CD72-like isoform X2 [Lagopus muta]
MIISYHLTEVSRSQSCWPVPVWGTATSSPMAQSVLYADLRFAKGPGGHGTTSQVLEAASMDDTDSPYENVVPGSAPVGTAGEGTQHSPDWQVNHQLQNVSREQATERGHFSQEAQVWKQSLRQTQQELAWVQEELQQAWQAAHRSQQELARQDVELVRVSGALNATQKELQDVQGKLSAIEQAASSLRVCLNADCCPSGWLLYRGKCLFISVVRKSWWDSHRDCVKKSSHLLIQDEWELWMLPDFLQANSARYWIRRKEFHRAKRNCDAPAQTAQEAGGFTVSVGSQEPWRCGSEEHEVVSRAQYGMAESHDQRAEHCEHVIKIQERNHQPKRQVEKPTTRVLC